MSKVKTYSRKADGGTPLAPNFRVSEFACKDGSDKILICAELVRMLQCIRDYFGLPVSIISGYRTPSYNSRIPGAASNSYHTRGQAADLRVRDHTPLQVYRAINNGWVPGVDPNKIGLGLYNTFVHVDSRGQRGRW